MRQPPQRPTYTFANGITVELERVGPLLSVDLELAHPPPSPPLAPGVGGDLEPNPADPDYQRAIDQHQKRLQFLAMDALLDAGISEDLEINARDVQRIRRVLTARGVNLDDVSDRMVYIRYVCVASDTDLYGVINAIRRYDSPREDEVAAAESSFRGDVPRPAAGGSPVAEKRPELPAIA